MIYAIIQVRMGSRRLQGKVMRDMDGKNPVLYYVLNQLQYCKLLDGIIIATTNLREDEVIVKYAKEIGIEYFRGSPHDVLDRYYQCAKKFSLSTIVRITSDNPLNDPVIIDQVIEKFKSNSYDYVTTDLPRTFPQGIFAEVFSFNTLETAWKNAKLPSEREHVTPYIYNHKDKFRIFNVQNSKNISHLRWTVDTNNDLELVRILVSKIKKKPILMNDILKLLSKEPELININKNHIPNEGYLKSLLDDEKFRKSNS